MAIGTTSCSLAASIWRACDFDFPGSSVRRCFSGTYCVSTNTCRQRPLQVNLAPSLARRHHPDDTALRASIPVNGKSGLLMLSVTE